MNVLVLLLFTVVVVVAVVLALTMHRLIAFRSPTASLQRCVIAEDIGLTA